MSLISNSYNQNVDRSGHKGAEGVSPNALQSSYLGGLIQNGKSGAKTQHQKDEVNQVDSWVRKSYYNEAHANASHLDNRKYSSERVKSLNKLPPEQAFLEVSKDNVQYYSDWMKNNPNASAADRAAAQEVIRMEKEMQKEVGEAISSGAFANKKNERVWGRELPATSQRHDHFGHAGSSRYTSHGGVSPSALQSSYLGNLIEDGKRGAKTQHQKDELNQVDYWVRKSYFNEAHAGASHLDNRKYSTDRIKFLNSLPPEQAFLEVSKDNIEYYSNWLKNNPNASVRDRAAAGEVIRMEKEMQKEVGEAISTGAFAERRNGHSWDDRGHVSSHSHHNRFGYPGVPNHHHHHHHHHHHGFDHGHNPLDLSSWLLDLLFRQLDQTNWIRENLVHSIARSIMENLLHGGLGGSLNSLPGLGVPLCGCHNNGINRASLTFY